MALTPPQREALERLLAAHEPLDDAEARHLEAIRDFSSRHADPFDRTVSEGHLTGSAFVVDPRGLLLLLHHRRLGIWVQLGGHAEQERDAAEIALREAREESGLPDLAFHPALRLPDGSPRLLDVDVHRIPARGAEAEHQHHDLRFLLVTAQPDAAIEDAETVGRLEWVDLPEALRRADPGMRRALARLERLRRRD